MLITLSFEIPGLPKGKGRPKFTTRGGFAKAVTPKDTVEFENLVRMAFVEQVKDHEIIAGPVDMEILAFFPVPKSASKRKREAMLNGDILYTKKPDTDNLAKSICDALNNIAYRDDSQIYSLQVMKVYAETPKTAVFLRY
jgi:Holliday junction resolvase RusA-like endonuclease